MGSETVEDVQLSGWREAHERDRGEEVPALVVAWSAEGLDRLGEVALIASDRSHVLGRGDDASPDAVRVAFVRQRPGEQPMAAPLEAKGISREQLRIRREGDRLRVVRVGRCPMRVNGALTDDAVLERGDTLLLHNQLLLLATVRTVLQPRLTAYPVSMIPPFGKPDPFGLVGESQAAWALRDRVATIAGTADHVLVWGESGTGKELVARSLHGLSERAAGGLVARNAATIPTTLADAELFGNAKNYPNSGMAERPGLIGEADGGTLLLDEVGELPESSQASLLRVLDTGGEYHRLGDPTQRRSSFRFVGATNRPLDELKHDLLARLTARITVPALHERPDDIPLLVRHILEERCRTTPMYADRFGSHHGPRIAPDVIDRLLRHAYTHHVRELSRLIGTALASSKGNFVALTGELESELGSHPSPTAEPEGGGDGDEPSLEAVAAALAASKGSRTQAATALGLSSRFVLYRLMKRYGLD